MLEHAAGSETCISVMSLIVKSLFVVSASGRVADLFCRNSTAVDMGFERGLLVNQVTGWMIDNVGQHRFACGGAASLDGTRTPVCGNKSRTSVSVSGFLICETFCCGHDDAGCDQSERGPEQESRGAMCETSSGNGELRNAGRLVLHEDLWDRWSRGLSFAMKMSPACVRRRANNVFVKEKILCKVEIRVRHRGVERAATRTDRQWIT